MDEFSHDCWDCLLGALSVLFWVVFVAFFWISAIYGTIQLVREVQSF